MAGGSSIFLDMIKLIGPLALTCCALVMTSAVFAQGGRTDSERRDELVKVEQMAFKVKDSTWMSARRPRMAAEMLTRSSGAQQARLAGAFLPPQVRGSFGRYVSSIDRARLSADKNFIVDSFKLSSVASGANALNSLAIGFGSHYVTDAAGATAKEVFEGIAQSSGVLTLDLEKLGPFSVTEAYTTTGDLTAEGKPEVFQKMVKVAGNKLRTQVLEGQGYRIEFSMPLNKAGQQTGSLLLEEKGSLTLNLTGKVEVPATIFTGAFESSSIIIKSQAAVGVKANIQLSGPVDAGVKWKVVQNPGGLAVSVPSGNFPSKGTVAPTFTFSRSPQTSTGIYPVVIEGTGFNGTAKLNLNLQVKVETYWIEGLKNLSDMSLYFCASSDGDYAFLYTPLKDFSKASASHIMLMAHGISGSSLQAKVVSPFGAIFPLGSNAPNQVQLGLDPNVRGAIQQVSLCNYITIAPVFGGPDMSVVKSSMNPSGIKVHIVKP